MDTKTIFSVESARSSVIDLAAKCKDLRKIRNDLKTRKRAGEEHPTVPWTSILGEIRISIDGISGKKTIRGNCSRYHQLAYAFLRGVPYRAVEAKSRTNPLHEVIDVLQEHLTEEGKVMLPGGGWYGSALAKEIAAAVQAWGKEDPFHLAYLRGIQRLNLLEDRGRGGSEEADKLREGLDTIWKALDERQRAWVERRVARMQQRREAAQARLEAAKARREVAA